MCLTIITDKCYFAYALEKEQINGGVAQWESCSLTHYWSAVQIRSPSLRHLRRCFFYAQKPVHEPKVKNLKYKKNTTAYSVVLVCELFMISGYSEHDTDDLILL